MKRLLTSEMIKEIEVLINKGSRAEVLIEKGKIAIVEVRRKRTMRI